MLAHRFGIQPLEVAELPKNALIHRKTAKTGRAVYTERELESKTESWKLAKEAVAISGKLRPAMRRAFLSVFFLLFALHLPAQQITGVLRGVVTDPSGASIPGAVVTVREAGGQTRSVSAGDNGNYVFRGLQPGTWEVEAAAPGLAQHAPRTISIEPANNTLNLQMDVATGHQEVTVSDTTESEVSLDPTQSASAQVMHSEDLGSLADDADDLLTDLQALAGPSAGLNGGQIFIDGFTDRKSVV